MAQYKVRLLVTYESFLTVEAESEDAAMDVAEDKALPLMPERLDWNGTILSRDNFLAVSTEKKGRKR